uniref:hypothetical protein n=1 Tax=uncultured Thiodictyon sp. TaxID=1846217 RepID=UPI0025FEBBD9
MTAYVTGPTAVRYRFTSALPVQILKSLEPTLRPLVARAYAPAAQPKPPAEVTALAANTEPVAPTAAASTQGVKPVSRPPRKSVKLAKPKRAKDVKRAPRKLRNLEDLF